MMIMTVIVMVMVIIKTLMVMVKVKVIIINDDAYGDYALLSFHLYCRRSS